MGSVLQAIVFCLLLEATSCALNLQAISSVTYEDIRIGQKLTRNGNTSSQRFQSQSFCGMSCNRDPECLSFNYCGGFLCQLNSEDVFSTEDGENILEIDPNCNYIGMKEEALPFCKEGDISVNIEDDQWKGKCRIYKKRVDKEWGPWEYETEMTSWKNDVTETREVSIQRAHGGKVGSKQNEKISQFILSEENWQTARDNCIAEGGKLFFRLDGSKDQLAFLRSQANYKDLWLGIYTEDHQEWKTVDGDVLEPELIQWGENQPDNELGDEFYLSVNGQGLVEDNQGTLQLAFVCDMNDE